jgi:FixJ family two-component response regulator
MVECLLIDRDSAKRKRLALLLTELGFNCAERSVTEEGIVYCHQRHPAVVMMEASAHMSTSEFLRKINARQVGSAEPIIILYADHPDVETVVQSIFDGAAEFLARPFDRDLLKFKLEQAGALKH